jgi:2-polyprenyl-3-methyl-5-hydroxy-6-metoxy-1,4-benzoquinol methylase
LATQALLSEAKNYNRWIFQLIQPFLGQRILDIGCATGNITEYFLDRQCVVGLDCDKQAIERIRTRFVNSPNFSVYYANFPKSDLSFLGPSAFDTIVCLNVLEHIADDVGAVETMRTLLVDGGRLILLVPAFRWLYGSLDAADGHFRRYSRRELREKLALAGFLVCGTQYMNFPGILGWLINGRLRKVPLIPKSQLLFYDRIVPVIQRLERFVRVPLGQSLIAVADKPS